MGGDDNGIAAPAPQDHILDFNRSGIKTTLDIVITGTNDTPEIEAIHTSGEVKEDVSQHRFLQTIDLSGIYEQGDKVKATINETDITYTVTIDDLGSHESETRQNIAEKSSLCHQPFNIETMVSLEKFPPKHTGKALTHQR